MQTLFSELKATEEADDNHWNLVLKISSIFIVWIVGLAFIAMPYFIERCRGNAVFLGLANSFSGGIFIGIGLFHLLPESVEIMEEHAPEFLKQIPFAFFLAFCSYSLILFVEKVAFNSHALIIHDHDHGHGHHHHPQQAPQIAGSSDQEQNKEKLIPDTSKDSIPADTSQEVIKNVVSNKGKFSSFLYLNNEFINDKAEGDQVLAKSAQLLQGCGDHQEHHNEGPQMTTWLTPYILLIAIGLHGFFEGVALGIQRTISGSSFILIAILAHKWAESLTLGISFVKANTAKNAFIAMCLLFSVIGPFGIVLGLILAEETNELVEGIFLGISTGTFIYVACSEVVVEEFAVPAYKGWKFTLFVIGSLFTFGLAMLELVQGEEEAPEFA